MKLVLPIIVLAFFVLGCKEKLEDDSGAAGRLTSTAAVTLNDPADRLEYSNLLLLEVLFEADDRAAVSGLISEWRGLAAAQQLNPTAQCQLASAMTDPSSIRSYSGITGELGIGYDLRTDTVQLWVIDSGLERRPICGGVVLAFLNTERCLFIQNEYDSQTSSCS